ncbi:hypothetical protein [Sphingomonas sp. CV7422]|uniref:hypothetical protein n=1 Tax=Sphingomonas sp. CV7422 TaxID=3018036 RepID=UPI0022FEC023|nr:hypothetical protein [Sphingomonas sp. CV7422]
MGIAASLMMIAAANGAPAAVPPGTVTVIVVPDGDEHAADAPAYAEAVDAVFNAANYLVLPATGPSRYRAHVAVDREARGLVGAPAPTKKADAAMANWGGGISIALPTAKQDLRALIVTRMTITLSDWRSGKTLWTGSAVTAQVGGTAANAPATVGGKLATALVARMPAALPEPLSVP